MYYVFQLGTEMLLFFCVYFFELLINITCRFLQLPSDYTEKIFIVSFPILLFFAIIIVFIIKIKRKKEFIKNNIFHPTSTIKQRCEHFLFLSATILFLSLLLLSFIIKNFVVTVFVIENIISILLIITSIILSTYFEPLPDKNDTLYFDDENLYYYLRVKKGVKSNKYMNSYIIPYDSIIRSYINNNKLYIENNRNHINYQVHREFSTNSKRIVISFNDYPELKQYIKSKDIQNKLKIKKIENIELSDYV